MRMRTVINRDAVDMIDNASLFWAEESKWNLCSF